VAADEKPGGERGGGGRVGVGGGLYSLAGTREEEEDEVGEGLLLARRGAGSCGKDWSVRRKPEQCLGSIYADICAYATAEIMQILGFSFFGTPYRSRELHFLPRLFHSWDRFPRHKSKALSFRGLDTNSHSTYIDNCLDKSEEWAILR